MGVAAGKVRSWASMVAGEGGAPGSSRSHPPPCRGGGLGWGRGQAALGVGVQAGATVGVLTMLQRLLRPRPSAVAGARVGVGGVYRDRHQHHWLLQPHTRSACSGCGCSAHKLHAPSPSRWP